MTAERSATSQRLTLRAIDRDAKGGVRQIIEQNIPATAHEVGLALRRDPFRELIAYSLLNNGATTLEVKK